LRTAVCVGSTYHRQRFHQFVFWRASVAEQQSNKGMKRKRRKEEKLSKESRGKTQFTRMYVDEAPGCIGDGQLSMTEEEPYEKRTAIEE